MLVDKPAGKRDREEEGAAERGKQSRDSTQELIVCLEGAAGEEEMLVHIRNGFRRPEICRGTRSVASQAPDAYTLNLSDRRKRRSKRQRKCQPLPIFVIFPVFVFQELKKNNGCFR